MKSLKLPFRYLPKDEGIITMEVSGGNYHQKHIHMHDHNEMLFITKEADCMIFSNGIQKQIHTPVLILHRGGSYHGTDMLKSSGGYSSFVIFFKNRLLSDMPKEMLYKKKLFCDDCEIFELSENELLAYSAYFDLMRREKASPEKMKLLLLLILCETASLSDSHEPIRLNANVEYIFSVLKYIGEHFEEKISIKSLSEQFHISTTKLNTDFRRVTDLTINELLTRMRLGHAIELLTNENITMADIAYRCGFSSESYFIQVFGKYMGNSPKHYATGLKNKT